MPSPRPPRSTHTADDEHVGVLVDMLMAMLGAVFVLLFIFSALARDYVGVIGRNRASEDPTPSAVSGSRLPIERPLIMVRAAGYRISDLECELRDPSGRLVATVMSTNLEAPVSFQEGRATVALEVTGRGSDPKTLTAGSEAETVRLLPLTSFQFELAATSTGVMDLEGYSVRLAFKPVERLTRQDVINARTELQDDIHLKPILGGLLSAMGTQPTAEMTPEMARKIIELFDAGRSAQAVGTDVMGPLRSVYMNLTKRHVPPNNELVVLVEATGLSGDSGVFLGISQRGTDANATQSCELVLQRNLDVRLERPSSVVLRP